MIDYRIEIAEEVLFDLDFCLSNWDLGRGHLDGLPGFWAEADNPDDGSLIPGSLTAFPALAVNDLRPWTIVEALISTAASLLPETPFTSESNQAEHRTRARELIVEALDELTTASSYGETC